MIYTEKSLGWEYISAVFCYFRDLVSHKETNSHIAPKYIYRGITKRYFTESERLRKIWNDYSNNKRILFDGKDITDDINEDINDVVNQFKSNAKSKPYNNCLKPSNGLKLKEIKEVDASELLYSDIYKKLKDKISTELKKISKEGLCVKNIEANVEILEQIHSWTENKLTQPEQIRSGASVRLRDFDKKYLTISDYLSYINNLIFDFKKVNPDFRGYSDLEILAEIQHRGGASCLVDFSKNFLISLWFATNNDFNEPGYLFCYNVNEDALSEDNITFLNKDRWGYSIEDLLKFTRKTAQYTGDDKFRFWLWKPANINGRIARQDSIFVFGLEKFYAENHNVVIITIPPQWKSAIVETLKTYFGITSETVFPDVDGYAGSHSKTSKIDSNSHYLNLDGIKQTSEAQNYAEILQRGMSCLLNGQYKLALDYFLRVYSFLNSKFSKNKVFNLNLIRLEVIYSIGLCYKKLHEYNSAEYFLNFAFRSCYELRTGNELNTKLEIQSEKKTHSNILIDKQKALFSKFLKITDDYLDVLYNLRRYSVARQVVFLLHSVQPMNESRCMLYCTLQRLSILDALKKMDININTTIQIIPIELKIKEQDWPESLKVLKLYHNLVICLLCNPDDVIAQGKLKANSQTKHAYKLFKKIADATLNDASDNENSIINWNFDDILFSVKNYFKGTDYMYLRDFIEDITSQIKSVFDINISHKRTI